MDEKLFDLHADLELDHWWFVARRSILNALLQDVVPPSPRRLIIDIGCGTGGMAAVLSAHYQYVGVDPSPRAVELARRRFPGTRFLPGRAPSALPAEIGAADAILLLDVLEHVEQDATVVEELAAAAAPGAHLLMTVPADPRLWSRHDESFGHFRRYTLHTFQELWRGLGMQQRLLSHYNARFFPVIKTVRRWGFAAGMLQTDLIRPPALLDRLLRKTFESEARPLRRALRNGTGAAFQRGVSLIAILEKW